jgi:hypothetical protein
MGEVMDERAKGRARVEAEQLQVYSLFDRDFSLAQNSIWVLKHLRKMHPEQNEIMRHLTSALLGDAVVAYSRPWLQSKGLFKKTHQLDHKKYVPQHLLAVHDILLEIRHREIAHTDLGLKKPSLARSIAKDGSAIFPVGFHSTDFEHMFGQIGMVDELLVHVRSIMGAKIDELGKRHDLGYKVWETQKESR